MKTAYERKYVVGGLAVVVLAGLLVWLIRSEGERTRQTIRDARRRAESSHTVILPEGSADRAHSAEASTPTPDARETAMPASQAGQQKSGIASAAEARPAAVDGRVHVEEDFNLDDHVVFPGLGDELSKTRSKPHKAPARTDFPTVTEH